MAYSAAGFCRCMEICCKASIVLLSAGLVVLIYWAIFQPHHIRAAVNSASLSNLAVAKNGSAVSYRLSVSLRLCNPSPRVNIHYDSIDAELRFECDTVIGRAATNVTPSVFYQHSRAVDNVTLDFDYGEQGGVPVDGDFMGDLWKETNSWNSTIVELAMDVSARYDFRMFKLRQKPRIWCSLIFPVNPRKNDTIAFGSAVHSGSCNVYY